ncbi:hypothetical protein [Acinetobacter sp. YH12140]|uniref:hypothetical protein n=1 Tax=Acinetobacter sp. YH12140 TaxID=2601124 RepID=UPI0015D28841|nr:hypothetical protein [Acinetobacter sp. YH12140]
MEFIEQIKEVMKESRKEMHVDQIAEAIVAKYPHTQQHLDVLSKKISSILSKDIDKYKTKSEFTKPKNSKGAPRRGIYRLKIKKVVPDIVPPPPTVNALYTGKAGEFAVMAELFFLDLIHHIWLLMMVLILSQQKIINTFIYRLKQPIYLNQIISIDSR